MTIELSMDCSRWSSGKRECHIQYNGDVDPAETVGRFIGGARWHLVDDEAVCPGCYDPDQDEDELKA